MKTTLNEIRKHGPCGLRPDADGTRTGLCKLLHNLGKNTTDDEPLSILTVLDSNGLDAALWSLRAVSGHDREIRLFAVWCARQVQHLMKDPRSVAAIDMAERFAHGNATQQELSAARDAACNAACNAALDAARAVARTAAWAAAMDAAMAAAGAAACNAALHAALDAARATAWVTAWAAAWTAALNAQEKELRRLLISMEQVSPENK
jgi:hypothetical protein